MLAITLVVMELCSTNKHSWGATLYVSMMVLPKIVCCTDILHSQNQLQMAHVHCGIRLKDQIKSTTIYKSFV